jgi:hypothetical protein
MFSHFACSVKALEIDALDMIFITSDKILYLVLTNYLLDDLFYKVFNNYRRRV